MFPIRQLCLGDVVSALNHGELVLALSISQNLCRNAISTVRMQVPRGSLLSTRVPGRRAS